MPRNTTGNSPVQALSGTKGIRNRARSKDAKGKNSVQEIPRSMAFPDSTAVWREFFARIAKEVHDAD